MTSKQHNLRDFQKKIWSYYRAQKRSMPWRDDVSPYSIVVSEIMLQQTQVDRVLKKYVSFMSRFPDWQTLARASNEDVLREWSGLGYNRRALYLKRIAEAVIENGGELPQTFESLRKLPGIGPNTAGSILAFAFNQPVAFIETNIRSVFIHHFCAQSRGKISDDKLMPLIEACLEVKSIRTHAREWYWALMDYGSHLKSQMANPSRRSAHHVRQKPFKGSNRELRSKILKTIMHKPVRMGQLAKKLPEHTAESIQSNLNALLKEGFLKIGSTAGEKVYQIA